MKLKEKPAFDLRISLAKIGHRSVVADYQKDRMVFSQGDPADAVFQIQKGKVKLTVVSKKGKEAIIAILGAGDFLGEGCLAGQSLRMTTATTMSECTIVRLDKPDALRLLQEEPDFSEFFLRYLLTRIIRIEEDLVDRLFNSTEKRLARVLLLLANLGKKGEPESVIPKISHEILAEMIGTTRPRVSFFMNKFRKLGFIDYDNDALEVHSSLVNVLLRS